MKTPPSKKLHVVSPHFNLQPYHAARYRGFVDHCGDEYRLTSLLLRATSEYALVDQTYSPKTGFDVARIPTGLEKRQFLNAIEARIAELEPDVLLLLGGYSDPAMACVIRYAVQLKIPMVICSESKEDDHKRRGLLEFVKARFFKMFSAALVGGSPHAAYAVQLGMDRDNIFDGYDAVDNAYFAEQSSVASQDSSNLRSQCNLPAQYFLASARFVEKKNFERLLEAYAKYREQVMQISEDAAPWGLVILGGGSMEEQLKKRRHDLGLDRWVEMPGFKQYPDLPVYYGLASAFVHASTREEWGLVINEAMACGLPVLVSNLCGCASDLVRDGKNGFVFDPYDVDSITDKLFAMSQQPLDQCVAMGEASKLMIENWSPARFGSGLKRACERALEVEPKSAGLLERVFLKILTLR